MAVRRGRRFEQNIEFLTKDKEYSVREVHSRFAKHFPKIMLVTQGYNVDGVPTTLDSISSSEVIRFFDVSKQPVVTATLKGATEEDSTYRINIHSQIKVKLLNKNGQVEDEAPFEQIIKNNSLPITVCIPNGALIKRGTQRQDMMFEIKAYLQETFLLGNSIIQGVLQSKVVHLPFCLSQIRLVEVIGIKGQSKEYWMHYIVGLSHISNKPSTHTATLENMVEPRTAHPNFEDSVNVYDQLYMHEVNRNQDRVHHYEGINHVNQNQRDTSYPFHELKFEQANSLKGPVLDQGRNVINEVQQSIVSSPPPISRRQLKTESMQENKHTNPYVNGIPRGQAVPFVVSESAIKQTADVMSQRQDERRTNQTFDMKKEQNIAPEMSQRNKLQIDGPISQLTIDDVADCLQMLNLRQFKEEFKSQLIDGVMLKELNHEILTRELGFKSIEAIRLLKFVEDGHIPK